MGSAEEADEATASDASGGLDEVHEDEVEDGSDNNGREDEVELIEVEVGVEGHVAEHAGRDADVSYSMSTLNGNCRSAATRAAQPARKTSRMPPAVAVAGVRAIARSAAAI